MDVVTCQEMADLVEAEEVVGKTLQMVHKSGPNHPHLVTMQFTGFYNNDYGYRQITYILTNPNVEDYVLPREFSFSKQEFVESFTPLESEREGLDYMYWEDPTPKWEL